MSQSLSPHAPILFLLQVLFNVFDAFVTLGGSAINAVEIIKGISEELQCLLI